MRFSKKSGRILLSIITAMLVIFLSSCFNRDKAIVATLDGATVTWGEIKEMADKFKQKHEEPRQFIGVFKTEIGDKVILPRILALEAYTALQSHTQLPLRLQLIEEEALILTREQTILEDLKYKDTVYKTFFTSIAPIDKNSIDQSADIRKKAAEILEAVKQAEDRQSYIDILEAAKAEGGYTIEWSMKSWFLPEADPYMSMVDFGRLHPGQHLPNPVQIGPAQFLIIYVQDKKDITHKNLFTNLGQSQEVKAIHNHFIKMKLNSYIDYLEAQYPISRNFEALQNGNPDDTVMSIKPHVDFSVKDIRIRMAYAVADRKERSNYYNRFELTKEPTLIEMIGFTDSVLKENSLLIYAARKQKLDQTYLYQQNYQQKFDDTFGSFYLYDMAKKDFSPSEEEIMIFYQNDPYGNLYDTAQYKLNGVKKLVPLEQVREQIIKILLKAKYEEYIADLKKELFTRYNVTFTDKNIRF